MDAIDQALMNSRLHYLGSAARTIEPRLKLAVLTCMDARVDVYGLLGFRPGDAHVIRNAGGRVTGDALRALALSQAVLGTREVMVIHHTECAIGRFTQSELADRIGQATGRPFEENLHVFTDPVAAVLEDLSRVRDAPHIVHRDKVRGFMYDLAESKLLEVGRSSTP